MDRPLVHQLLGTQFGASSLVQILGSGKLSAVYRAQFANQQSVMTTLFLLPGILSPLAQQRFTERFLQKETFLAKLNHPSILPTYEFGQEAGYCYITTPFPQGQPLAQMLQQKGAFSPEDALKIMQQLASALDSAHEQGVVHGSLSSSTIFVQDNSRVQIVGFGFNELLRLQGIEEGHYPYAHLFSVAHTFLGNPEYFSPEYVQGASVDIPTDIYAVGVLLYELLSATCPFSRGNTLLEVALQQVTGQVPSLQHTSPGLSAAFDLVIQQALEKRPDQRPRSVGAFVRAFERTVSIVQATSGRSLPKGPMAQGAQDVTLLPTVDWFSAKRSPSLISGREGSPENSGNHNMTFIDPFLLLPQTTRQQAMRSSAQKHSSGTKAPLSTRGSTFSKGRRQTLALLSTGGVAMLGGIGVSMGAGYFLRSLQKKASSTPEVLSSTMPMGNATQMPMGNRQPTTIQTTPLSASATPVPSGHTGAMIGSTSQKTNSVSSFLNSTDTQDSFLVHLPDGNFVAYEKACTHEGVPVYYDPGTQHLICPRHHAIFDPADGARVLQGPAPRPLASVAVRVNADGTVTTGEQR